MPDQTTPADDGTIIIRAKDARSHVDVTLAFPIEHAGVPITGLRIRRPKVGDQLAANRTGGSDEDRSIALIANLAELPVEAVHAMDGVDFQVVSEIVQGFTKPIRKA